MTGVDTCRVDIISGIFSRFVSGKPPKHQSILGLNQSILQDRLTEQIIFANPLIRTLFRPTILSCFRTMEGVAAGDALAPRGAARAARPHAAALPAGALALPWGAGGRHTAAAAAAAVLAVTGKQRAHELYSRRMLLSQREKKHSRPPMATGFG